jgi:hypothetical protein
MRDPELAARAQRAATRLESAWTMACTAWTRGRARAADSQLRRLLTQRAVGNPGELPGQVTDQLAAWLPGPQTGADQPLASA